MSITTATLQDVASVDDFLNVAATETLPLFDYLEFEFLHEYDVFGSSKRGRTRVFVALCLRLVVTMTNYERGNDPGCEKL